MLRITINGQKTALYSKRRINPTNWDVSNNIPFQTTREGNEISIYLENLRNRAYSAFTELSLEFEDVTPAMIKNYLNGVNQSGSIRTIIKTWQEHNDELRKLIGKGTSYTTWQKHNTCKNHFCDFLQIKYKVDDVPIRHIRYNLVREFHQFLLSDKGNSHNTAIKFLQLLKKIVTRSLKSGWLKIDPFEGMSLSLKETDRPYLTETELMKIEEIQFPSRRLELVKDLFVFSCYTGMSYSDVKKLVKSELERSPDGMWWIKTRRAKTKQRSHIPLLKKPMKIIEKYNDITKLESEDKVLPVLSNQKLNSYLKEIADRCDITKNLTYHVARHTFATTVTLQNGVSIESVSKMLGHSNIRTTQHYAKIVDKKIAEEMKEFSVKTNLKLAFN